MIGAYGPRTLIAVLGQPVFISINIYTSSSKANAVAENLFIRRFLMFPHLHRERGSRSFRFRALFERSWKWCGHDLPGFLDAVNREIYLQHLVVLIKLSIFGTRYRFPYRMEKNRDMSPYRFIAPPLIYIYIYIRDKIRRSEHG